MGNKLDTKRIIIYLAFAFGIAWAGGLAVYLTGGMTNSPVISGGLTLALLIITVVYMGAPALAHLLTRLITGEGWNNVYLRPKIKKGWPYWLAAWFGPGILTLAGMVIFFVIFPQYYDASLSKLTEILQTAAKQAGTPVSTISPWLIIIVQAIQAMLIAPLINSPATFGEEFGWRAYLQPKLMPLGARKAVLLTGVIWGVWHWPVIAMGHNYGLDYPGAPWLGMLAMVWFCILLAIFLGWATLHSGSVWPAVIGHAAINGIAGLGIFLVKGNPNPLLGPTPVGIIGSLAMAVIAALIFLLPGGLKTPEAQVVSDLPVENQ